jgi:hypothetical protein
MKKDSASILVGQDEEMGTGLSCHRDKASLDIFWL